MATTNLIRNVRGREIFNHNGYLSSSINALQRREYRQAERFKRPAEMLTRQSNKIVAIANKQFHELRST